MSRTTTYDRPLYRSRRGWIFGVCRGIAEYRDIPVFWVRFLLVILLLITSGLPTLAYLIAAIFMKPEPKGGVRFDNDEDEAFYNTCMDSPSLALSRVRRRFEQLDRRARRLEDIVTDRTYDWDERLKRNS